MTDELNRPFGFWTATALVVGGIIGTGIFMIPASLAPFGWTGLIGWIISIAGVLCIAYALGRLSAAIPDTSGAIALAGAALGPLPGVLIGWSYWVSCWTSSAILAIGATSYLTVFVPSLSTSPLAGALSSVGLLWLLTILNLAGAKSAGRFQVVTTVLKLLPLAAVIIILCWIAFARKLQFPTLPSVGEIVPKLTPAITLTLFPLIGFEAAGVAAERVRDPARTIMRATMAGTLLAGLLFVVVSIGIVFSLPSRLVTGSDAPFALFVEIFWGHGPALLVALFAVVSAVGALNCWVLLQSEVPLGMARANLIPAWIGKLSRREVPVRALIASSMLASLLILSNASRSLGGLFTFVALLTTCATLWLYIGICLAAVVRGVAVTAAVVGLAFTIWAMWGAGLEPSALSLALMLTALPLYWVSQRRARKSLLLVSVPS